MLKVELIGNLVKDPKESKGTVFFTVAVNQGEGTYYVNVLAFKKLGEVCMKYLAKGRKVYVEGLPEAETYTNKEGISTASLKLLANNIEFLSSVKQNELTSDAGDVF